jgi:RNA polymerase sigma-70 factor (ECF subfamily)
MATAVKPLLQTPSSIRIEMEARAHDDGLSAFVPVRRRLFGIAYRMLGSAAEAEDIVQDVWLRWQSTNRNGVENPPAFLATTTTRLCINVSQSAHTRRETYIGTWFPEPVDTSSDPGLGAEREEALKLAVLMLLEKLSPAKRAAYVLREAFDYTYRQIADILQMDEGNARQLVSRARKHIADGRCTSVSSDEQRRFLEAFIDAARKGDLARLEALFAEDLISYSGGGLVRAARVPVSGRKRVATFIAAVASHFWKGVTLAAGRDKSTGGGSKDARWLARGAGNDYSPCVLLPGRRIVPMVSGCRRSTQISIFRSLGGYGLRKERIQPWSHSGRILESLSRHDPHSRYHALLNC